MFSIIDIAPLEFYKSDADSSIGNMYSYLTFLIL